MDNRDLKIVDEIRAELDKLAAGDGIGHTFALISLRNLIRGPINQIAKDDRRDYPEPPQEEGLKMLRLAFEARRIFLVFQTLMHELTEHDAGPTVYWTGGDHLWREARAITDYLEDLIQRAEVESVAKSAFDQGFAIKQKILEEAPVDTTA